MDPAVMFAFATMLLETAKAVADKQPSHTWPEGCISLANRAADLFDKALKAVETAQPRCIWTVWLVNEGSSKIPCIKTLREFTRLGLKEAKDLVESCPCALLETEDTGLAREMYEQLIREPNYAHMVKPVVELRRAYPIKTQEVVERSGPQIPSGICGQSPEDRCCPDCNGPLTCPDEYPG